MTSDSSQLPSWLRRARTAAAHPGSTWRQAEITAVEAIEHRDSPLGKPARIALTVDIEATWHLTVPHPWDDDSYYARLLQAYGEEQRYSPLVGETIWVRQRHPREQAGDHPR